MSFMTQHPALVSPCHHWHGDRRNINVLYSYIVRTKVKPEETFNLLARG